MANKKVRVAIIGVGNCASSLVQGIQFYKDTADDGHVPGIMHSRLGGYHIRDIEFTLGIDVNVTKVGKDLSEAIFAEPNNTYKFADVPHLKVPVVRGTQAYAGKRSGRGRGGHLRIVGSVHSELTIRISLSYQLHYLARAAKNRAN